MSRPCVRTTGKAIWPAFRNTTAFARFPTTRTTAGRSTVSYRYEPIPFQPADGIFPHIHDFFAHIFGEQVELGYDYLQLLYLRPLQRLPVLLLVSDERNTGKTTFLNLLKSIFGGNVTFNTNEDLAVPSSFAPR